MQPEHFFEFNQQPQRASARLLTQLLMEQLNDETHAAKIETLTRDQRAEKCFSHIFFKGKYSKILLDFHWIARNKSIKPYLFSHITHM